MTDYSTATEHTNYPTKEIDTIYFNILNNQKENIFFLFLIS